MSEAPDALNVAATREAPHPGSLEARVAKRRQELERHTTEKFDVPGFEGVFQVELQIVGAKRQHAILTRHERIHDEYQKILRAGGDMLLAATVGFHAIVDAEGNTQPAETSWRQLAQAYDKSLDDTVEARVALIRLLGENGVVELVGDWRNWMRTRGVKLESELERDF